jgi:polyhydroxybutyrate depolymerase
MPRSHTLLALVALSLLPVAGCRAPAGVSASGAAVPVGSSAQTLTVGGRERTFHLYRPAALAARAPLVVMLHGGFGSGTQAEQSYGWDARADTGQFLVAYPDGLDRAWAVGGGCCGESGTTGVNDVGFIVEMVSTLSRQLPVDPARVYATGISNGGLLSYRLACDTTVFAAIGPDSATLLGPCPSPAPISVIHIHGTADHNIPYDGGPGDGFARIDGPAVPGVVAQWRDVDQCTQPTVTTAGPVSTSTATCPGGRSVELITIAGAGHQWPGSHRSLAQRLARTDQPSVALDATDTIWRFFAAHPKV